MASGERGARDLVVEGRVPWHAAGWREAREWEMRLRRTPKDDWDLTPRTVAIEAAGGGTEVVHLDVLQLGNQLLLRFEARYPVRLQAAAHLWRYMEIGWFLRRHAAGLERRGVMRRATLAASALEARVTDALIDTLCELPYRGRRRLAGQRQGTFDYVEVIQAAARRSAASRTSPSTP